MHETVLASSIARIVLEELRKQDSNLLVTRVTVQAGVLNCMEPHTLQGAFSLLVEGTAAEGANLEIEIIPLQGSCTACHEQVSTQQRVFACPLCGADAVDWEHGHTMQITAITVIPATAPNGEVSYGSTSPTANL